MATHVHRNLIGPKDVHLGTASLAANASTAITREDLDTEAQAELDQRLQTLQSFQDSRNKRKRNARKSCRKVCFGELANVEPKSLNFEELCRSEFPGKRWHDLSIQNQVDLIGKALKPRIILIDPNATYARRWDLVVCCALAFVTTITPFEIAFLESKLDAFFFINRLIDLVFLKDMFMQFFLRVEIDTPMGKHVVRDIGAISRRYLRGGFIMDFISILPFDVFAMLITAQSDDPQTKKLVRIVRLLRLLKLLRITRVNRIVNRYRDKCTWRFTYQALIRFMVLLATMAHLMACTWGMIGMYLGTNLKCNGGVAVSYDGPASGVSWIVSKSWPPDSPCVPTHVYVASLHFAVMTITSIGYGDIGPTRIEETIVGILCQLLGGITWAYVIGSASSVLSMMNVARNEFESGMDSLNYMLKQQKCKPSLVFRMREYFRELEYHKALMRGNDLSKDFSRELKAELTLQICVGQAINKVWYFKSCQRDFVVEVAQEVVGCLFAPGEVCNTLQGLLCIIERGSAAVTGRIYVTGGFWGEDMIINSSSLQVRAAAICLSYAEILALSKEKLMPVLDRHPETAKRIRKAAIRIATIRAIQRVLKERQSGQRKSDKLHKLLEEAEVEARDKVTATRARLSLQMEKMPLSEQKLYTEMQEVKKMVEDGLREVANQFRTGALPLSEDKGHDMCDVADQLSHLSDKLMKLDPQR